MYYALTLGARMYDALTLGARMKFSSIYGPSATNLWLMFVAMKSSNLSGKG
jgi:hypothetical protein